MFLKFYQVLKMVETFYYIWYYIILTLYKLKFKLIFDIYLKQTNKISLMQYFVWRLHCQTATLKLNLYKITL